MKQYFNILLICVVSVMGCQTARNLITKSPSDFQSLIACEQAAVILTDTNSSTPNSPSKKYKRSECPECKGKGYIMSGDGLFKQNCPYCEPDNSTSAWGCPCGGNCQCQFGECGGQYCPTNRSGQTNKGKNISNCGRVDCPCKDCKCVKGGCKCKKADECNKYSTQTPTIASKCCVDCICPAGNCKCTYPGECLVRRAGGKPVKVCDGNSCRQYQAPARASNSTPNAKATITQPKSQRPAQFGNNAYSSGCSSGNCSSGGWGSSRSGGRRYGGRGWF